MKNTNFSMFSAGVKSSVNLPGILSCSSGTNYRTIQTLPSTFWLLISAFAGQKPTQYYYCFICHKGGDKHTEKKYELRLSLAFVYGLNGFKGMIHSHTNQTIQSEIGVKLVNRSLSHYVHYNLEIQFI